MPIKRREFLGLTAALAATPALTWSGALAADATPAATPVAMTADDRKKQYGPVQGAKPYKIAYMQVFPDNPFWTTMKDAIEARAKENGVTVDTIALPTASGVSEQVSQFETVVTQKYDGVILGTVDAAGIVPGIEGANKAGIPVISVDTMPAGGAIISIVQTDNIAAAKSGGEFILARIGTGKILNLQGDLANQTGQARSDGVHQALDGQAGVSVIDQSTHWLATEGQTIVENILTSDPDIKAIFSANDPPALAAVEVLKAHNRADVVVVGFDGTKAGLQAIKDGTLAGDVLQFPDVMGVVALDLLVRKLNGETVPTKVDSGSGLATKDNVDQYLK